MRLFLSGLLLLLLCLQSFCVMAQNTKNKINIEQADSLQGGRTPDGENFRKLKGNVRLRQGNTRIFGDSLILYPQRNVTEVFGKVVRIEEGDSIVVTGKSLVYDGNTKVAEMRKNVVYRDPSMTLYTDFLNYDIARDYAYYFQKGRLVDSVNVLTSVEGSYHTVSRMANFKDQVVLTNPDYTLESDTMQYNTETKIAYTKGPTVITSKEGNVLNAQAGSEYNTTEKEYIFGLGTVETEKYTLKADQLFLDDAQKRYNADQNVVMISKENDVIITGEHAYYLREQGITKVYGNPVMKKIMTPDTLYLTADTLVSIEDSIPDKERILAYYKVKIYREDLQGISDSLAYHTLDSMLYFYNDPVLWNKDSQIMADSINVQMKNNQLHKMNTTSNSFVISQDTIRNFNQVKGRKMEAFFLASNLDKIKVFGNGESVYYALEDTFTVGMNRILCSDMTIEFDSNKVDKIHTYVKPEASFVPPQEINEEISRLKGFRWRSEERPEKQEVLRRTEAIENKQPIPDYPVIPVTLPGE